MKNREFSDEHKENLSKAASARIYTEEDRIRNSESHKGLKHSEETKKKMSETRKKIGIPPEVREANRRARLGKSLPEEVKKKISESLSGKTASDETKQKMSEQRKGEKHPLYGTKRPHEVRCKIRNSISGEKHPNWQGGASFDPYCEKWNPYLRLRIRAFFGFKCVLCGREEILEKRHLHCHHVHYNKKACCDDSEKMFAPLCHSCHSKTTVKNRKEEWIQKLSEIIIRDYGGKCYFTHEEYCEFLETNESQS
jgi:hypothetical protein